jgi:hypothetical protein
MTAQASDINQLTPNPADPALTLPSLDHGIKPGKPVLLAEGGHKHPVDFPAIAINQCRTNLLDLEIKLVLGFGFNRKNCGNY